MGHSHSHHHHPANYNRAFALGVLLNGIYIIVEVIFGFLTHSLALLADAGHNLSDVLGLILAWGAHYLAQIAPTERRTYGWRNASILAALANALILLVAIGGILWEAIRRFNDPAPVASSTVIIVALIGVVINTLTALLFLRGCKDDLNIKGAFLHMAADAAISLGVVIAAVVMLFTKLYWIDPATSIAVAVLIFLGTWGLLRESFDLALQAVPKDIDLSEVRSYLRSLPQVTEVHDLHVWAMSTTETALTAHLVRPGSTNDDALLAKLTHELRHQFHIAHVTVQIERDAEAAKCQQATEDSL